MQDEVEARDWSGVDGATAWHLIDRHANNWTDVGEMMNAWLASNSSAALRQRPVVDDARMARALEWVRVMAMQDANGSHLPAIEEAIAAYDPNCGGRTVRVVDDAMVERALDAHIPGGGQVRDFGLPRWAMLAALLAAYQQDNGGK